MKNKRLSIVIGAAVLSLLFTACGTQMYTLSDEQEEMIVQYAAHIVGKYNIRQTDGMTSVLPETETETDEEDTEPATDTEKTETDDSQSGGSNGNQNTSSNAVSMAKALGYEGLTIKYLGSEQKAGYKEGNACSVDAAQGKIFYIMNFELSNTTADAIQIDNISLNPAFKLVGAGISVKAEVTVLSADLSTYKGEIKSGETVKTVILFEVSQKQAESLAKAGLQVTVGKQTKTIEL